MRALFLWVAAFGGLLFNVYLLNQWGKGDLDGGWFVFGLIAWVILTIWAGILKFLEESREDGYDSNQERKELYRWFKKCPECKKKLPSYNTRKCPYCTADI